MAIRFLELGLLVSAVRLLMAGFLSRLGNMSRALGEVLSFLLFFVNDFLIVRNVSGVRHDSPYSISGE